MRQTTSYLIIAAFLILYVLPVQAQNRKDLLPVTDSIPKLWEGHSFPAAAEIPVVEGAEFHVIKPYEFLTDGYRWLHGVALAWHKGRLYATFGHNNSGENMAGEEARGRSSDDGGKTWSPVFTIDRGIREPSIAGKSFGELQAMDKAGLDPGPNFGVSHGVLLSRGGELWSFNGAFGYTIHYNHHVRAYRLDEKTGKWLFVGRMLDDFWPINPPRKMDDGNWIMAGMHTPADGREAAVAISHGEDLTSWDLVVIPKIDSTMWGESGLLIEGNRITNISRSGPKVTRALVAISEDYGRTWSPSNPSNLPMASVKPCVGTLSTGQHYLISSTTADGGNRRSPLTIAVSRPGEWAFSQIYVIRDAEFPGGPGESHRGISLSYPDAVEYEGKLYVAYSNNGAGVGRIGEGRERANNNSAELAIIPISSLKVE